MLRLDYTAMSLNPKAKLYGKRTLWSSSTPPIRGTRACLEAFERELDMPWALYHVRRLFLLSASGERRPVMRSTERVGLGRARQLDQRLISVSERHGIEVEHDPVYGRARSWVRRRRETWPIHWMKRCVPQHAAFRTVQVNGARIVDEWLPVKEWLTAAVKEWHTDAPAPYSWTYDSVPGDWAGTSRCSCSLCVFASRRDVLLSIARRPRLADLYAEVEQVRGDSFRADWRITDLIRHAEQCGAPDPGVACPDDGPEFTALKKQVRAALKKKPRKEPELARRAGRALCDGCTVHS